MDTTQSSLGDLVGLAVERELVQNCCIAKDGVTVTLERLKVKLPPEGARELLRLLFRGVNAEAETPPNAETGAPLKGGAPPEKRSERPTMVIRGSAGRATPDTEAAEAYQKREVFRAPSVLGGQEPAQPTAPSSEPQPVGGDGDSFEEESISEEYLDSVLSFALTMNIIEGYTKDRESQTVTLRTGATTTGLSYWETLEYLTNSMLYELRPRSGE